ncbi:hypothetical protein QQ045_006515 [Rhodiola kirilowii]
MLDVSLSRVPASRLSDCTSCAAFVLFSVPPCSGSCTAIGFHPSALLATTLVFPFLDDSSIVPWLLPCSCIVACFVCSASSLQLSPSWVNLPQSQHSPGNLSYLTETHSGSLLRRLRKNPVTTGLSTLISTLILMNFFLAPSVSTLTNFPIYPASFSPMSLSANTAPIGRLCSCAHTPNLFIWISSGANSGHHSWSNATVFRHSQGPPSLTLTISTAYSNSAMAILLASSLNLTLLSNSRFHTLLRTFPSPVRLKDIPLASLTISTHLKLLSIFSQSASSRETTNFPSSLSATSSTTCIIPFSAIR